MAAKLVASRKLPLGIFFLEIFIQAYLLSWGLA